MVYNIHREILSIKKNKAAGDNIYEFPIDLVQQKNADQGALRTHITSVVSMTSFRHLSR